MQHGPLVNFYLSLNHGFALVNYGSREEASKVSEVTKLDVEVLC